MRSNRLIKTFLVLSVWLSFAGIAFADLDDERDIGGRAPATQTPPAKKPIPDHKRPPATGPDVAPNLGAPAVAPSPKPSSEPTVVLPLKPNTSGKKTKAKGGAAKEEKHDSKQPINWSAKGLKGSKDSKIIDLLNDVVVTQGNVKLEADKAKVFFTDKDEVSKVEAVGNVKVTKAADLPQDRISARGNEAVFDNGRRTVTLIGRAALWRGGDVVRGKQIVYNLDTGWINVDSVEGVVQPGEEQKNETNKSP